MTRYGGRSAIAEKVTAVVERETMTRIDDPDLDLLDGGLLDSIGLASLVASLEDAFDHPLPPDRIDFQSLRSVTSITHLLDGARAAPIGGTISGSV